LGVRIGLAFNLKPLAPATAAGASIDPSVTAGPNGRALRYDLEQPDLYAEWDEPATIDAVERALRPLGEVIRLVPHDDPYRYGHTFIESFMHAIPNLGGQIGSSQRQTVAQSDFLETSRFANLPPSDWLTYRLVPEKYGTGEGVGFTAIGEAYLNFGYAGVVGFFALLGYMITRLDCANLKSSSWLLLFACVSFWHLSRTVRDDFSNWVKPSLFLAAMIFAIAALRRMIWKRA